MVHGSSRHVLPLNIRLGADLQSQAGLCILGILPHRLSVLCFFVDFKPTMKDLHIAIVNYCSIGYLVMSASYEKAIVKSDSYFNHTVRMTDTTDGKTGKP
jgi:hypothetical protein